MTGVQQLELPARAASAREARRWVSSLLGRWHVTGLADQVELLTTELVTNALLHAGTTMTLRAERSGAGVRLEVEDGSAVVPVRRLYSPTATTGRGTRLLDALADEWGWHATAAGKVTWARVETQRDAWGEAAFDEEPGEP